MEGRNFLVLNAATLSAAVTEYLNKRATSAGEIRATYWSTETPGGSSAFKFALDPKDQEQEQE